MIKLFKNGIKQIIYYSYYPIINKSLTVFNYHQVSNKFDPRCHDRGTWTDRSFFEKQMEYIKENYFIVSLQEGLNLLKSNKLKEKFASVTFDDGDNSLNEIVPYLTKANIPATFFINTAYLNNRYYGYQIIKYLLNLDDFPKVPEYLKNNIISVRNTLDRRQYHNFKNAFDNFIEDLKPNLNLYICESFIEQLDTSLFQIGLHGHTHERYSMMDDEWQKEDLKKNIDILSSYKNYVPIFAIPYGKSIDWTMNTIKLALNLDCQVAYHDAGINTVYRVGINRIPADGSKISELMINNLFG